MNQNTLDHLVNKHYSKIKNIVYGKAFAYYIDKADLLSAFNIKLAVAIQSNTFIAESEAHFWGYIHLAARNTANDYKRKMKPEAMDIDDHKDIYSQVVSYQPDIDLKQFSNFFLNEFADQLSKGEKVVFKLHFIDGLNYNQLASELQRSLGQVKSIIFTIRKKANQRFGNKYRRLVA